MFNPSQADVRRFFCSVYAKSRAGQPLEALETIASHWMDEHPEYAPDFADLETALATMGNTQEGRTNPFLHLSMHLSITEQCSIDQPRGIRQAIEVAQPPTRLAAPSPPRGNGLSRKDALESQQAGRPPDGESYVACVQRHATQD